MTITKAFGWRPSRPDKRDIKFRPRMLAALPASVNLDSPSPGAPFDPAWDQGNEGSCGPNTTGENIVWDELKLNPGAPALMPSRQFMYYTTRDLMGTISSDSGVDNRTMLQALSQFGWCDEVLWPYNPGPGGNMTTKPTPNCYAQALGRAGGIVYQAVNQDLQTMKACLAELNRPFVFGFTVYDSMLTPAVDASGDIPMPGNRDNVAGGHDVSIVGYDDATQKFKVKNHWTPQWGRNGYGTVPYAYALDPNLSGDFWVVVRIPTDVVPPPPPPSPTPPPAPSGLRQQIDAIFADLEARFTNPVVHGWIAKVQALVDAWLDSQHIQTPLADTSTFLQTTRVLTPVKIQTLTAQTSSQLQQIIDGVFVMIEAGFANRPLILFALRTVNGLIDQYLASHNLLLA